MQTTLESLGQLERRLKVAVPMGEIEGEVQKRLASLAKTAKISGFRPGKVPIKMIAQQYGPQVRSDVITDAVQTRFNEAIRAENVRVAGNPRIESSAAPSQDTLEFSAVFEVYPEVKLGDLTQMGITRPVAHVTPEDVERTVEVLRQQRAHYHAVTHPAKKGDRVVVDFTGTIDGVEFAGGQARDFTITLGEGRMLPEFEAALDGMSAGGEKAFPLTFPADYHGKEVAGKGAQFALTVKSVEEPHVPPLNEDFVKAFGVPSGNIDELKAEIAANLNLELKRKIEQALKEQAIAALRATSQFTVPRSLVDIEAQNLLERARAEVKNRGGKPDELMLATETFAPQAEQRVAFGLILNELVRAHQLQPKPAQVRALVEEHAQSYEQPDAVVRWHYEQPERMNEFEILAVERNVVDWVLSKAQVQDRPTTFAALMEPAPASPAAVA